MEPSLKYFPDQASSFARPVDALFFYELAITVFFTTLIFALVIFFAIKYRRRSDADVPEYTHPHYALEITWTIIPLLLMMTMFFWGAYVYVQIRRPPANAMTITVMGKQWMWKVQHPEGPREINSLHVPIGRPIKLVMTSQDVIHDFFIPEFRTKMDVLPGSFTSEWFVAEQPGEYHLFCSQYCGNQHASMVGKVVAMEPKDYQAWLAGASPDEPPAVVGSRLFQSYGCAACHGQRAPTMAGLYMSRVTLDDAKGRREVVADEDYLRRSIIDPAADLVAGFGPIMPTYRGQLTEEQIMDLIEYIKSLGSARANVPVSPDESVRPNEPAPQPGEPATQPVNGVRPDRGVNQPPAKEPIQFNVPGSVSR